MRFGRWKQIKRQKADGQTAEGQAPAGLEATIAAAVEKGIASGLAAIKASREPTTDNARGAVVAPDTAVTSEVRDASVGKGINVARVIKTAYAAKMTGRQLKLAEVAREKGYEYIAKALSQSVFADGGVLVPDEFVAELIPLLRNKTAVRKHARSLQMGATMTMPVQTSAGTAYYGPENGVIQDSQQGLGSKTMKEKKLTAETVTSNDLIRNASIQADEFILNDLVLVMALREDLAFLRGTGVDDEPLGILNAVHATHKYDETVSSVGNPTLAEIRKERAKARRKLKEANIPMTKVVWIGSARTEEALLSITDGNGNAVYEEQLSEGRWGRDAFEVTQQVPDNLKGSGNRSELYCVDFGEFVIGDSMQLQLDVFPNGTYESGGYVRSGISRDQTVIRAIAKHDDLLRHDKAAVVVENLSWGL